MAHIKFFGIADHGPDEEAAFEYFRRSCDEGYVLSCVELIYDAFEQERHDEAMAQFSDLCEIDVDYCADFSTTCLSLGRDFDACMVGGER